MGRRGPLPAPAAVQALRGQTRPSRVNWESPVPVQVPPDMPRGMDDRAKVVWRRVLRDMAPAGVITSADTDVLRAYCEAVSNYTRNIRLLRIQGPTVPTSSGGIMANPMARLVREDREAIRILSRDLGLSPAARAALRIEHSGTSAPEIDATIGAPKRLRSVPDGP